MEQQMAGGQPMLLPGGPHPDRAVPPQGKAVLRPSRAAVQGRDRGGPPRRGPRPRTGRAWPGNAR